MADASSLRYRRVLLKLSGEALMGTGAASLDATVVDRIAGEIAEARSRGAEIGIVVGGGNIFRGVAVAASTGDRVGGDQLGMLATVMNAIAIRTALTARGVPATILSALDMPAICDRFTQRGAMAALAAGEVVIFAAGTGHPYFTTDTGAALRAAEIGADALLKGTQVDGVYSADPKSDPSAVRYDRLSYQDVLSRGLAVMDAAAVALAREAGIPVVVFSIHEHGSFLDVLGGRGRATVVA
jgi:uridylate kinase